MLGTHTCRCCCCSQRVRRQRRRTTKGRRGVRCMQSLCHSQLEEYSGGAGKGAAGDGRRPVHVREASTRRRGCSMAQNDAAETKAVAAALRQGTAAKPSSGGEVKPQEPTPPPPAATAASLRCTICDQDSETHSCSGCKKADVPEGDRPRYCCKECQVCALAAALSGAVLLPMLILRAAARSSTGSMAGTGRAARATSSRPDIQALSILSRPLPCPRRQTTEKRSS